MTQSKPLKRKKKTKNLKPKNEESKVIPPKPTTPQDKRRLAENNVREMIKEAHVIHKNYNRLLRESKSKEKTRKLKEHEKPEKKISRLSSMEIKKTGSQTKKGGIERNVSAIKMKAQRTTSEDMEENVRMIRQGSDEFGRKKFKGFCCRQASAEFQIKKKEEIFRRGQSAGFPVRKRVDGPPRQGSEEFSAMRKQGHEMREFGKKQRENSLKVKDYKVGSFVSLEVLDKMKCHDSDTGIRSRKRILRQSRQDARKPKKVSSKSSDRNTKKLRMEEKRKKDDGFSENKFPTHKAAGERKRNTKSILLPKRESTENSESIHAKREQGKLSQTKSVISNPKSASSNLESNFSSITWAGDIFSSNTSRSYFSSDSDISKIDKKFMEILEAVTRTKIDFEEREKRMNKDQTNDGNNPSILEQNEDIKQEPGELEQKLLSRISYLEQKLEHSRSSTEDESEKKKESLFSPIGDVSRQAGVEEVCEEENDDEATKPAVNKKPKDDATTKTATISKSYEGMSVRETALHPKQSWRRQETIAEVKPAQVSEVAKIYSNKVSKQEISPKRCMNYGKQEGKEIPEEKGETGQAQSDTEDEDAIGGYKRVETWSIMKRLEKALQTLGLNVDDLDNSDEDEKYWAKKKPPVKKYVSTGQVKRGLSQSEALKRCQKRAEGSIGNASNAFTPDGTPVAVVSNGSGDKNTEYKRVRSSKKIEDLATLPRERRQKEKTQKETNYTSGNLTTGVKFSEICDLNGLPEGKHSQNVKSKSMRKRSGCRDEKEMAGQGAIAQNSKTRVEEVLCTKTYGKRSYVSSLDDSCKSRGKSKSVYSLSVSCSESSITEEDYRKGHKRKKKNPSLVRESCLREREVWTNANGKGDTMSQTLMSRKKKTDRKEQSERPLGTGNERKTNTNGVQVSIKKPNKISKMEENDELELKQIRRRHRQIISEIKLSLDEIKRQHNLCAKLRRQTKEFNRDCHAKNRILASYLKDVEMNYKNGKSPARGTILKHSRALSTDSYCQNMSTKIRGKHSDCDMLGLRKYDADDANGQYEAGEDVENMIGSDNETSTEPDEFSSIVLDHTSTEFTLSDSTEESYHSMASSLRTVCRRYRPIKAIPTGDRLTTMGMECWQLDERHSFSEGDIIQGPSYLVQLLKNLNKIIVTEKSQFEDVVVKASTSSNVSIESNKTKSNLSTKSSKSSFHMKQQNKSGDMIRPALTEYEICSVNVSRDKSSRQYKSKGSRKSEWEKSPDTDDDPISRSRSFIRGDPGGRNFEGLLDQEREIINSESHATNQMDTTLQSGTSCIHLEKHAEERRYRKGDPSFRAQSALQQLGEHSRHCMEKVRENDDSRKRKLELERILRVNEKMLKRSSTINRGVEMQDLDSDSLPSKGRQTSHGRHRQQSIIDHNDHNRGEENEESQIVLGHASRHSGVAFGYRKHSRRVPHEYIKISRKRESSHLGKLHEFLKKGKRYYLDELPINFYEIYANTPGPSCRLMDAYCQTDIVEEYDDNAEIYLLEEIESNPSLT